MKTTSGTKTKNVEKVYHLGNTDHTNQTTIIKHPSPTAFFTGSEKLCQNKTKIVTFAIQLFFAIK